LFAFTYGQSKLLRVEFLLMVVRREREDRQVLSSFFKAANLFRMAAFFFLVSKSKSGFGCSFCSQAYKILCGVNTSDIGAQ